MNQDHDTTSSEDESSHRSDRLNDLMRRAKVLEDENKELKEQVKESEASMAIMAYQLIEAAYPGSLNREQRLAELGAALEDIIKKLNLKFYDKLRKDSKENHGP